MVFDDLDLEWLTETVRSHMEAVKQLEALPLEQRQTMTAQLANRSCNLRQGLWR